MQCPQCHATIREGLRFCEDCGARLALICARCAAAVTPGKPFCGSCGTPLVAPAAANRFASPDSYTPNHLAEKIVTSRAALAGERKQITVVFADLRGSMELLADRDPEDARRLLDPVLELMMEGVHRYEGTVNQVMGDGIMALFGAPLAHEDHAVRACYAALRMQERVKQYAEEAQQREGVSIQIRVGLNSGEVVVRSIGSDLRMDYTAVGQTTHLAARLEQMAMPGSILISPETLRLAEGYVMVNTLGRCRIKGLDAPLDVYEVVSAATVRSRFQAATARGLTRFVGREGELDQLRHALEQARAGQGQIVAVVGEPGVGKSRLYWEFTHSHRAQGWRVIESGSVSYGKATNYFPVVQLLRAYFEIEAGDEPQKIREKVTRSLLPLDRHLEPAIPALLWLLDAPIDDPVWEQLEPSQRRQRVLDGVKRLLLRESQMQPLMVVFEDLHWIDAETQALLDSVIESLPTARLLLLVNYRPEYQHTWSGKTSYRQLRIDPLPAPSADELLEALLGNDADLHPLKQLVIERTEGNPFFLEETVRTLVETRALIGERGAYRLAKGPAGLEPTLQIPASAQALLAARIDRLSPEHKSLLQAAAVIGTDVPFALLQAIADEPEDRLRQGLAGLQSGEFLYETRLFPDLEYTFKHALTHEVAYGSLLHKRRRALHGRIVEAVEQLHPDRLDEQVERLAHHAVKGELGEKAVSYLRQAGARAFRRSANREAVAFFEQALPLVARLPESRQWRELAVDLRFDLRNALQMLGQFEAAIPFVREAQAIARELDDPRRLGLVSAYLSWYHWATGRYTDALRFAQEVLASAETLDDLPLRVVGLFYEGVAHLATGNYPRATQRLRAVANSLTGDLAHQRLGLAGLPASMSRCFLAWALGEQGLFIEGIAEGREGIRIAETIDHPYSVIMPCWGLGHLYGVSGDFDQGIPYLERALTLVRERNVAILFPMTARPLGYIHAQTGRVGEGMTLLEQALSAIDTTGLRLFRAQLVAQLGEVSLMAGRSGEARRRGEEALVLARELGERGSEAYALRLLGEVATNGDLPDDETGEGHYRAALALANELTMRPLAAHCHLGLAKFYRRSGEAAKTTEHLTTATAMYREMDMGFWLAQAGAVQKALT